MPALASLEEFRQVDARLKELAAAFPDAYSEISDVFKKYRKLGYKNVIKLMLAESTPEKLKES